MFLESVNFSACVYMQIFNFRDGHVTTSAPFMGLYLQNAWSQTRQTSERLNRSESRLSIGTIGLG